MPLCVLTLVWSGCLATPGKVFPCLGRLVGRSRTLVWSGVYIRSGIHAGSVSGDAERSPVGQGASFGVSIVQAAAPLPCLHIPRLAVLLRVKARFAAVASDGTLFTRVGGKRVLTGAGKQCDSSCSVAMPAFTETRIVGLCECQGCGGGCNQQWQTHSSQNMSEAELH